MREILLKGKRKDNGELIEGSLITSINRAWISSEKTDSQRLRSISNTNAIWRSIEIIPDTICQFTGLYDKYGNKIWENDIIKYHFGEIYAPIKYGYYQNCFDSQKTEHLGFYVDWTGDKCLRKDLGYWIDMVYAMPVGNIFDNKELLQEESDE